MEERDDLEQMAFIQKWNDGKAETGEKARADVERDSGEGWDKERRKVKRKMIF